MSDELKVKKEKDRIQKIHSNEKNRKKRRKMKASKRGDSKAHPVYRNIRWQANTGKNSMGAAGWVGQFRYNSKVMSSYHKDPETAAKILNVKAREYGVPRECWPNPNLTFDVETNSETGE
eukprot:UN33365